MAPIAERPPPHLSYHHPSNEATGDGVPLLRHRVHHASLDTSNQALARAEANHTLLRSMLHPSGERSANVLLTTEVEARKRAEQRQYHLEQRNYHLELEEMHLRELEHQSKLEQQRELQEQQACTTVKFIKFTIFVVTNR